MHRGLHLTADWLYALYIKWNARVHSCDTCNRDWTWHTQELLFLEATSNDVCRDIENDGWKCSDTCHILLMCVGCKASIMDIFIITVYEMPMWQYARGFSKWWPCKDLSPDSAAHCGLQSFILSFSSLFSSVTATFLSWFTLTGPRHTSKSTNFKTYILGVAELSEVLLQMLHKDSPCKQYFQAASQYQYRQKRSYSINLKFWFHWAIWSD